MSTFLERSQLREGEIHQERIEIETLLPMLLQNKELELDIIESTFPQILIDGIPVNIASSKKKISFKMGKNNFNVKLGIYEVQIERDYGKRCLRITLLSSPPVQLKMFPEA